VSIGSPSEWSVQITPLISRHLTSSDLISPDLRTECAVIGRSHGKLGRFTSHTTHSAVAATDHGALGSDEIRSAEVRRAEWDMNTPYEHRVMKSVGGATHVVAYRTRMNQPRVKCHRLHHGVLSYQSRTPLTTDGRCCNDRIWYHSTYLMRCDISTKYHAAINTSVAVRDGTASLLISGQRRRRRRCKRISH